MQTTRRLLNGETLLLDVPDAAALPGSTTISVLSLDGVELEVNGGSSDDLDFYLSLSGTSLTEEVRLRGGEPLRCGRYGGDPASGWAFALRVGDHEVYGFTVPTMDLEELTAHLAQVDAEADPDGPALRPGGHVSWSTYRTHTVAQVVDLGAADGYLLDLRRTRSGSTPPEGTSGVQVRGGLLARSSGDERHAYAVLEAPAFVSYGIPGDQTDLDVVATSLASVTTELA